MAKVFDFQMPVIYVIFKSTIPVVSTTSTDYFDYYEVGLTPFLCKSRKSVIHQIFNQSNPVYLK